VRCGVVLRRPSTAPGCLARTGFLALLTARARLLLWRESLANGELERVNSMVLSVDTGAIDALRAQLTGDVFVAADSDYDTARSIWNGAINRKPAIVARCASPQDVAHALRFGRDRGLQIAVRGGGHNFAGFGTVQDGLMISLAAMNEVRVQPAQRKAFCGG